MHGFTSVKTKDAYIYSWMLICVYIHMKEDMRGYTSLLTAVILWHWGRGQKTFIYPWIISFVTTSTYNLKIYQTLKKKKKKKG